MKRGVIMPITFSEEFNVDEKKLDELKIDWRGSVEYRLMNMPTEQKEEILLQSLKDGYRSSINYRDSRREQ